MYGIRLNGPVMDSLTGFFTHLRTADFAVTTCLVVAVAAFCSYLGVTYRANELAGETR